MGVIQNIRENKYLRCFYFFLALSSFKPIFANKVFAEEKKNVEIRNFNDAYKNIPGFGSKVMIRSMAKPEPDKESLIEIILKEDVESDKTGAINEKNSDVYFPNGTALLAVPESIEVYYEKLGIFYKDKGVWKKAEEWKDYSIPNKILSEIVGQIPIAGRVFGRLPLSNEWKPIKLEEMQNSSFKDNNNYDVVNISWNNLKDINCKDEIKIMIPIKYGQDSSKDIFLFLKYEENFVDNSSRVPNRTKKIRSLESDISKIIANMHASKDNSIPPELIKEIKREYIGYDMKNIELVRVTDLNSDGINEVIWIEKGFCGASGFCSYFIWRLENNRWKEIGDISAYSYRIEKEKTNGFFDIIVLIPPSKQKYKWDGLKYELK